MTTLVAVKTSDPPAGPGERWKTSFDPFCDIAARPSPAVVLMPLPSCTAVPQGSSVEERDAVQMSVPPRVPVRVESQTISRPLLLIFGRASAAELFTPPGKHGRPAVDAVVDLLAPAARA